MVITEFMSIILVLACIIAVCCASLSVGISTYIYLQWKAKELSTHNIQYVPLDPKWGTSDEKLSEINNALGSYDTDFNLGVEDNK